jgi:hypothetical protein
MEYFYKVNITDGREVHLKEMNLEQYKNLQKICIESDFDNFKSYISTMINNLMVEKDYNLNLLDIYIITLNIRKYSVSDEKVFNTFKGGKKTILKVSMDVLVDPILNKYDLMRYETYELDFDDFIADKVVLKPYDCDSYIDSFIVDGKKMELNSNKDIKDILPLPVKNKIDNYFKNILSEYNLTLFTLTGENGVENDIKFEMNERFIYDFLRIIIKDDLKTLYRNLYDVKTNLGIGFDEHPYITLSELEMYISMYNIEQEKEQNKNNSGNGFPQVNM